MIIQGWEIMAWSIVLLLGFTFVAFVIIQWFINWYTHEKVILRIRDDQQGGIEHDHPVKADIGSWVDIGDVMPKIGLDNKTHYEPVRYKINTQISGIKCYWPGGLPRIIQRRMDVSYHIRNNSSAINLVDQKKTIENSQQTAIDSMLQQDQRGLLIMTVAFNNIMKKLKGDYVVIVLILVCGLLAMGLYQTYTMANINKHMGLLEEIAKNLGVAIKK